MAVAGTSVALSHDAAELKRTTERLCFGQIRAKRLSRRTPCNRRCSTFVFLSLNTMTDAQLRVTTDVAALLDRVEGEPQTTDDELGPDEREAIDVLRENGFL